MIQNINKHVTEQQLRLYLTDRLPDAESNDLCQHLNECDACQAMAEKIVESTFSLKVEDPTSDPHSVANRKSSPRPNLGTRFLILDELARGGMGIVFRGFDRELQRIVAIKVSATEEHSDTLARFYREAQISGQLQHPGIVPVHHLGNLADGRLYIVMKLVHGQTLTNMVREQSASGGDLKRHLDIFGDICQAVAYVHSAGFIHRDLKPDNIMIGAFGEVQVMDWGLAKKLAENDRDDEKPAGIDEDSENQQATDLVGSELPGETRIGDVFGTSAYMPPEQADGRTANKQSDVFTLGGILFYILTAKAPFGVKETGLSNKPESFGAVMDQLDKVDADRELVSLAKSCLAAQPCDRPADAAEVCRLFQQYTTGLEQKFENARLENVRTTERLAAQRKQIRQLLWSGALLFTTVIAASIAGYMYLAEKNTRIANEARIQQDVLVRKMEQETAIRENLSSARAYMALAGSQPTREHHAQWSLAKKEIEKAALFVNESMDLQLHKQYKQLQNRIEFKLAASKRRKNHHRVEDECRQELLRIAEISQYPEDMGLCYSPDLLPEFAKQFGRLGIKPGIISHQAIERLQNSDFHEELIYGLMMWRRELNLRLGERLEPAVANELNATWHWIAKLIDNVDSDPFRKKIRTFQSTARFQQIIEMAEHDKAISSLLTVHTVALSMANLDITEDERVNFLLRAHQRFPDDFFVNWYMATYAGFWSNAKEFSLACYSLRPENPGVLSILGTSYLTEGQFDRAIETLQQLVKVAPWYQRGQYNLAWAYHCNGDLDNARKRYRISNQLLEKFRGTYESRIAFLRECNHHEHADDLEQELDDVRAPTTVKAINPSPTQPSSGELAQRAHLQQEIVKQIQRIRKNPKTKSLYRKLAKDYVSLGKSLIRFDQSDQLTQLLRQATTELTAIAKLAPDIDTSYRQLATICARLQRRQLAIEALQSAIEINPTYAGHHNKLEQLYRERCTESRRARKQIQLIRSVEDAIETLSGHSRNSPPNFVAAHAALARFCQFFKRYQTAIVATERALQADPDSQSHRQRLGELHMIVGRRHAIQGRIGESHVAFDAAITANSQWVEHNPESATAHEQLSFAYRQRGKLETAFEQQRKALKIKPDNLPARFRYAMLALSISEQQHQANQLTDAIGTIDDAINFLKAIRHDGFLMDLFDRQGDLQLEADNLPKAILMLRNVSLNRPGNQFVSERLARAYIAAGEFAKAEPILLAINSTSPESEHVVQLLADFYLQRNKRAQAESLVRQAYKNGVGAGGLEGILTNSADAAVIQPELFTTTGVDSH